jgi:hypothetical protein
MDQRATDTLLRKQALDAALSYVATLGPKYRAAGPHLVVEIAETFHQFLSRGPENV